jgi:hypothetical protein
MIVKTLAGGGPHRIVLHRTLTAVICKKGEVGKSTITDVLATVYSLAKAKLLVADADSSNSTTHSTHDGVRFLDIRASQSRGSILNLIRRLETDLDNVLVDFGARDDSFMLEHTPWFVRELEKVGAKLLVVMPVTSEPATHMAAFEYAKLGRASGAGVLIVRNFGRGLTDSDFAAWTNSTGRKTVISMGAVQCDLKDLGPALDIARGFQLSIEDVAMGRFERAGKDEKQARTELDEDTQAWFAIWLDEQCTELARAINQASAGPRSLL